MITRSCPLIHPKTGGSELAIDRSLVLIELISSRMSIEDIAVVLNCTESLVRSVLVLPFFTIGPQGEDSVFILDPKTLTEILNGSREYAAKKILVSDDAAEREQPRLIRYLAAQIQCWLESLDATDADRQHAIERAKFILDESSQLGHGKYRFQSTTVTLDIMGLFSRHIFTAGDNQFRGIVGRWLASWMHFWVTDPGIWNPALEINFDHFKLMAEQAMP